MVKWFGEHTPHVIIEGDGTPIGTRIFVNGVELKGVSNIAFEQNLDRPLECKIEFYCTMEYIRTNGEGEPFRSRDEIVEELQRIMEDLS